MEKEKWQGGKGREGAVIDLDSRQKRKINGGYQTSLSAVFDKYAIALGRVGEDLDKNTVSLRSYARDISL